MAFDAAHADEDYCYLTTTGRISGQPREIEIWFALEPSDGTCLYMLAGGRKRANWVQNLLRAPDVTVRIAGRKLPGRARVVEDTREEELARGLLFDKYSPRYSGDLARWRGSALPVAVDFAG